VIPDEKISVDSKKIKVIIDWIVPKQNERKEFLNTYSLL